MVTVLLPLTVLPTKSESFSGGATEELLDSAGSILLVSAGKVCLVSLVFGSWVESAAVSSVEKNPIMFSLSSLDLIHE